MALVGQLASGLAHEIGTPLNIIAGNAELLGMDLRERDLGTAEVDAIIQHADRITRLIQQLLTFARAKEQSMATCRRSCHASAAAPSNSNRCSSTCSSMPGMPCPTVAPSPLPPL